MSFVCPRSLGQKWLPLFYITITLSMVNIMGNIVNEIFTWKTPGILLWVHTFCQPIGYDIGGPCCRLLCFLDDYKVLCPTIYSTWWISFLEVSTCVVKMVFITKTSFKWWQHLQILLFLYKHIFYLVIRTPHVVSSDTKITLYVLIVWTYRPFKNHQTPLNCSLCQFVTFLSYNSWN
jgi:hypothetical protein